MTFFWIRVGCSGALLFVISSLVIMFTPRTASDRIKGLELVVLIISVAAIIASSFGFIWSFLA